MLQHSVTAAHCCFKFKFDSDWEAQAAGLPLPVFLVLSHVVALAAQLRLVLLPSHHRCPASAGARLPLRLRRAAAAAARPSAVLPGPTRSTAAAPRAQPRRGF